MKGNIGKFWYFYGLGSSEVSTYEPQCRCNTFQVCSWETKVNIMFRDSSQLPSVAFVQSTTLHLS